MTGRAVVGVRVALDVGFCDARARLRSLAAGGLLLRACEVAYGEGTAGLAEILGPVAGPTRLADVYLEDLTQAGGCPLIAVQWDAIAANGKLFTALIADLTLLPAGGEGAVLSVTGTYWPPPGRADAEPGRSLVRCQAAAVMSSLLDVVACQLAHPAGSRPEIIT